jgi:hypothetical protein
MLRTRRLAQVLTSAKRNVWVRMAEAANGLSQVVFRRQLMRHTARERSFWSLDRSQHADYHIKDDE